MGTHPIFESDFDCLTEIKNDKRNLHCRGWPGANWRANYGNISNYSQELVVSRGWRLPDYSLASEAGPAHKKEFIICCSVEKLKEYGNGSSKKSAKRNAATAMLSKLKDIPVDSKEHIVDNDDFDTSFTGRGSRGFLPIEMLRNSNGERILLDKAQSDPNSSVATHDPLQALNEHAAKHCFTVDYLDIEVRSTCGLYQCLLRLHTLPVSVVHGQGATARDSHVEAARNALQYLAIVASEKTQSAAQLPARLGKKEKKTFLSKYYILSRSCSDFL